MNHKTSSFIVLALSIASLAPTTFAKDDPIAMEQCPPPVQAIIRHYSAQATLETIAVDKKAKSGGPEVYEAKFAMKDGKRIEIHISPEGKVLQMEEKKRKD